MHRDFKLILPLTLAVIASLMPPAHADDPLTAKVLGRFPASQAHQGVAVDREHIYAIANRTIGKYDKQTGLFCQIQFVRRGNA